MAGIATAPLTTTLAGLLCSRCMESISLVQSPKCTSCGIPFVSHNGPDHLCGQCLHQPNHFDRAHAYGLYDHALRELIHQYKFQGHAHLAAPLGKLLWAALQQNYSVAEIDMVIPVPLHHRRLRKRGFNQAALLVGQWPSLAQVRGLRKSKIRWLYRDVLVRRENTTPQTGLNKKMRKENLRSVFAVAKPSMVTGKRVLLIDDVFTTGATANACSLALKRAGAADVDVLTLARAV